MVASLKQILLWTGNLTNAAVEEEAPSGFGNQTRGQFWRESSEYAEFIDDIVGGTENRVRLRL